MKKILALVMACLLICLTFAGCGAGEKTDMEYVKEKGKLVVGITNFAPMDYKENGEWVGFDAELAKLFAEKLGVEVEFAEITWGKKIMELDSKTIDCVWNGMTLNDEVKAGMDCSDPYCTNAQVVVVPSEDADKYKTAEDCKDLQFAVEDGSAGEEMAEANGFKYTPVDEQSRALTEVKSGTCDAAIIDLLMAGAMVGEGTGYADLTYTVGLNSEEYGVGFRKGSDLVSELNAFFDECIANGTMMELAEKYGVQEAVIVE